MKTIPLTKGMVALVDDEDYDFLNQWEWCAKQSGRRLYYAERGEAPKGVKKRFSMHNAIMRVPEGQTIDHRDRDGLNNQKSNLRASSQVQNTANRSLNGNNTSGFKGVTWDLVSKKWVAQICFKYKNRRIGYFASSLAAALAYDAEAIKISGEFAATNKALGLLP